MKNNENAEVKYRYEKTADPNVYLSAKQIALTSKFLESIQKEMGTTWMNNAMGVGCNNSKYLSSVCREAAKYRASQWLFVVNRVYWRLPESLRKEISEDYQKLQIEFAFPKSMEPVAPVVKETEPAVVQKQRKKVRGETRANSIG